MREIKFRAWDKEMKRMQNNLWSITFHPYISEVDKIEINIQSYLVAGKDGNGILMQFTGLLDKNGKEIYEKDIALYGKKKAVIEWNTAAFHLETFGKGTSWGAMLSSVHQQIEVIGNIYEDKHLLDKPQKEEQ